MIVKKYPALFESLTSYFKLQKYYQDVVMLDLYWLAVWESNFFSHVFASINALKVATDHNFIGEEGSDKNSRATYATYITHKAVFEYYTCLFNLIDFNDDYNDNYN